MADTDVEKLRQLLAWAMRLFEDAEIWRPDTEVEDFEFQVREALGDEPWALPPHLIDHPDDETDDPDDDGEEQ
jgi:hypothetical protein